MIAAIDDLATDYFDLVSDAFRRARAVEFARDLTMAMEAVREVVANTPARAGDLDLLQVELANTREAESQSANNLRNRNGERDYLLGTGSLQWGLPLRGISLTVGADVFYNFLDYHAEDVAPFPASEADQTLGYVFSVQVGQLKQRHDWLVGYYYRHIETLDHDLQSEVSRNRLHAPGQLTISGLELDPAAGRFGTFMGLPRDGVLGALKNQRGQISVSFVLEGNIDDPQFSLNEAFTTRLASSLAESLGISLGGLATGVGSMGQKGVEAVGEAAKGAMQQIFEDEKTR